eukprot:2888828-Prymnesium_polylepis.1
MASQPKTSFHGIRSRVKLSSIIHRCCATAGRRRASWQASVRDRRAAARHGLPRPLPSVRGRCDEAPEGGGGARLDVAGGWRHVDGARRLRP